MIVLFERLGFSENASAMLVDGQGIDDLSEISLLTDDGFDDICKLVRRPGDNIINPNADAAG